MAGASDCEYAPAMIRILLAALFVVVPACEKSKPKETDRPSGARAATRAALGDVVATAQLPSGNSVTELAPIIERLQPGGASQLGGQLSMLLGQAAGVDLSGADLSKPVAVVLLNPKKYKDPVALLVTPKSLGELESSAKGAGRTVSSRDGLALIGPSKVVASAKNFAFATLAKPSKQITITIYPEPLVKAYRGEIARRIADIKKTMDSRGLQGKGVGFFLTIYQDAAMAVAEQTERVTFRFETSSDSAGLVYRLYPRRGSTMAAFVGAQVVADHALLKKLPARQGDTMVFSGEARSGAARTAMVAFATQAMTAMYGRPANAELKDAMAQWFDAFSGSTAMTMNMNIGPGSVGPPGMSMNYLMGTTDSAKMRKAMRQMFVAFGRLSKGKDGELQVMGIKTRTEFKKNVFQVSGVEVDHYHTELNTAEMDPQQRAAMKATGMTKQDMYLAAFDNVAAMVVTNYAQATVTALISAARGKAPGFKPTASLAKEIAASKLRKESMLMFMDLKSFVPAGTPMPFRTVTMGMGKADDGALAVRLSLGL